MSGLSRSESSESRRFPREFLWGASTSSYQIEGAVDEDGRGRSIWDVFCESPGRIHAGDTGVIACDSYHRVEEDLRLLTELGVEAYRFSIAWPRVQPDGRGPVNERGLDHYRRLVEALRARNILPAATIYHWELPQALQDDGGWAARDTAQRLAEYAAVLAEALGDQVGIWITLNEPLQSANQGYRVGTHAPGHRDLGLAAAATHHLLLGHGLALQAIRTALPAPAPVGIALDLNPVRALDAGAEEAVAQLDAEQNRMYLEPVLYGRYPTAARAEMLPPDSLIGDDDMAMIAGEIDFLGVNYYRTHRYRVGDWDDLRQGESPLRSHPGIVQVFPRDLPRTVMDWVIEPEGLHETLTRVHAQAPQLPIYITENGCAAEDYVNPDGQVNDFERVAYLHGHLDACWRAIQDGVNLAGYFHWSLMDNFEWAWGYQRRFGLYYVEFGTQRRIAKRSAGFYAGIVATGELPARDEVRSPLDYTPESERTPQPPAHRPLSASLADGDDGASAAAVSGQ